MEWKETGGAGEEERRCENVIGVAEITVEVEKRERMGV